MEIKGIHELVVRVKANEIAARELFCKRLRPDVLRFYQIRVPNNWQHMSANDLTQETIVHVLSKIHSFNGGSNDEETGRSLKSWLQQVLQNEFKNELRSQGAKARNPISPIVSINNNPSGEQGPPIDPPARDSTPSQNLRSLEREDKISQVLASISDNHDREILKLRFFENKPFPEIVQILAETDSPLSYDQIRGRFHKLIKKLSHELKDI